MATWEQEKGPQPETEEAETVGSPEKALRRCTVCGTQFEGDAKTTLPVCPECNKVPYHPEGVPL